MPRGPLRRPGRSHNRGPFDDASKGVEGRPGPWPGMIEEVDGNMAKRRLAAFSTMDLRRELEIRQSQVGGLVRERDSLARRLAEIDREIEAFGGVPAGAGGGEGAGRGVGGAMRGRRGPGRPPGRRGPGRPPGSGAGRKRPDNAMTLNEALRKVLTGRTMGVTEMAEAVQKAGYKSNSAAFRTIVNQTLIKNPRLFKKVARGQYTAA